MGKVVAAVHTVIALFIVAISTIVLGLSGVAVATFRPGLPLIDRLIVHNWSQVFLAATLVKLEIVGQEHVDPDRSYIFVSNHLSDIDIPAHFLACSNPVRYLAKKELFAVPIFGFILRRLGFIRVDRQAGPGAHRVVNEQVKGTVGLGRSLIIYPEGTRSRTAEMAPFKKGAFRIAWDNDMAVLPMAISRSAYDIWPPGSKIIRRGSIRIVMGPPLEISDFADIGALRDEAEAVVHKLWDEANAV